MQWPAPLPPACALLPPPAPAGIAVRGSFNQNAARTLLTSGILDSLSTGILIYVGLINLVNPMMTDSPWLRSQRWPVQVAAFVAFYAGAGAMAVIGKWA